MLAGGISITQCPVEHDRQITAGDFSFNSNFHRSQPKVQCRLAGGKVVPFGVRQVHISQNNGAGGRRCHSIVGAKGPGIIADHQAVGIAVTNIELGPLRHIREFTLAGVKRLIGLHMLWVSMQAGQDCGQLGPGQSRVQVHLAIAAADHNPLLTEIGCGGFLFTVACGAYLNRQYKQQTKTKEQR